MGYLTKQDVKSYFKGDWLEESKSSNKKMEEVKNGTNLENIAKAEYYDNEEYYTTNKDKYSNVENFIQENIADISYEYSLTEKQGNEVCKLVYNLMKNIKTESKLQETGEWDYTDSEMNAELDYMREQANKVAENIHGSVASVTGFDKYQGPRAIISTPIHGDVEFWFGEEDGIYNCKVAHVGWITGTIERISDLLDREIIPQSEIQK